jgi:hypothetical protein
MRLAGHVASICERRSVFRISVENLWERDHFGDRGVDGKRILRWIFRK